MLTIERAREVLAYDPETGVLTWKVSLAPRGPVGAVAGYSDPRHRGRIHLRVDGKLYLAHRIIWLLVYGQWPVVVLDHIDGDPSNNRLSNIRAATAQQNSFNQRKTRGTSRCKGVSWDRDRGLWFSKISRGGKQYPLGRFQSEEEAHAAYCEAAKRLFGEFARFN